MTDQAPPDTTELFLGFINHQHMFIYGLSEQQRQAAESYTAIDGYLRTELRLMGFGGLVAMVVVLDRAAMTRGAMPTSEWGERGGDYQVWKQATKPAEIVWDARTLERLR